MHQAIEIVRLGLAPYEEVWQLQKKLLSDRIAGRIQDRLLVCAHPPVITIGKSGNAKNVIAGQDELKRLGINVLEVERGGDVTFHGPGQVVLYPIMDLSFKRKDVGWYMRSLEETALRTLAAFEISGARINGRTGVWIGRENEAQPSRKIAALGVRISRWCTMHGLSLNVNSCTEGFALINPCGYDDIVVTSMEQELGIKFETDQVADKLVREFQIVFDYAPDLEAWQASSALSIS